MLSPFVALRVNSAKHLCADGERPFAAAQGDTEGKHLRGSTVKLDTFMLVSGKHCQARLDLIEPCLNYVTCQRALNTLLIKYGMALAAYLLSFFQVGQCLSMAGFFPIILS